MKLQSQSIINFIVKKKVVEIIIIVNCNVIVELSSNTFFQFDSIRRTKLKTQS